MLKHPYLKSFAALAAAWMCFGAAGGLGAGLAYAGKTATPGVQFFGLIAAGILLLLGWMMFVNGCTCMAYGVWRKLAASGARSAPAERHFHAPQPFQPLQPAATQVDLAPISIEPEPAPAAAPGKPVRLVMREPSGKVVGLPLRDPAKIDHYRAKYEQRGYRFLRTEPL